MSRVASDIGVECSLWEHTSKFCAEVGNCPRDICTVVFTNMCLVDINFGITDADLLKEEFNLVVVGFSRFSIVEIFVSMQNTIGEVLKREDGFVFVVDVIDDGFSGGDIFAGFAATGVVVCEGQTGSMSIL